MLFYQRIRGSALSVLVHDDCIYYSPFVAICLLRRLKMSFWELALAVATSLSHLLVNKRAFDWVVSKIMKKAAAQVLII